MLLLYHSFQQLLERQRGANLWNGCKQGFLGLPPTISSKYCLRAFHCTLGSTPVHVSTTQWVPWNRAWRLPLGNCPKTTLTSEHLSLEPCTGLGLARQGPALGKQGEPRTGAILNVRSTKLRMTENGLRRRSMHGS